MTAADYSPGKAYSVLLGPPGNLEKRAVEAEKITAVVEGTRPFSCVPEPVSEVRLKSIVNTIKDHHPDVTVCTKEHTWLGDTH